LAARRGRARITLELDLVRTLEDPGVLHLRYAVRK
jgi:hypothetical protein